MTTIDSYTLRVSVLESCQPNCSYCLPKNRKALKKDARPFCKNCNHLHLSADRKLLNGEYWWLKIHMPPFGTNLNSNFVLFLNFKSRSDGHLKMQCNIFIKEILSPKTSSETGIIR